MDEYTDELKILLLPKDPDDDRNVIIEIRGGAGGEEAALLQTQCSGCTQCMHRLKAGKQK